MRRIQLFFEQRSNVLNCHSQVLELFTHCGCVACPRRLQLALDRSQHLGTSEVSQVAGTPFVADSQKTVILVLGKPEYNYAVPGLEHGHKQTLRAVVSS